MEAMREPMLSPPEAVLSLLIGHASPPLRAPDRERVCRLLGQSLLLTHEETRQFLAALLGLLPRLVENHLTTSPAPEAERRFQADLIERISQQLRWRLGEP
jgi:hypothetical protein